MIHVSDTPDDRDIGAAEIRAWHIRDNGWSDIGYHEVIRRNGTVEHGRSYDVPGAHVAGHNQDTIGICWVGREKMTSEQRAALLALVKTLCRIYSLTAADVYGHKELAKGKSCPNLNMDEIRSSI